MNELLAQGPEFAGENIPLVPEVDPVEKAAAALLAFWRAHAANDPVALQAARKDLVAAPGTNPVAIRRRAHELRCGDSQSQN